jgi:ribosomal-protein-alanine N-acetyltransferase
MDFELRTFQHTDLQSLVLHANNYNIAKNLSNKFPFPYTQDHGIAFINLALSATPQEIFAIVVNGEAVGSIGVHPQLDFYCKNAEMGYWISEAFWGQGIATCIRKNRFHPRSRIKRNLLQKWNGLR